MLHAGPQTPPLPSELVLSARFRYLHRQTGGKGRAMTDCTFDGQIAAQQPAKLAAQVQAQPGAAVLASDRGVGLSIRLEQMGELLGRDPDPGVPHAEADPLAVVPLLAADVQRN